MSLSSYGYCAQLNYRKESDSKIISTPHSNIIKVTFIFRAFYCCPSAVAYIVSFCFIGKEWIGVYYHFSMNAEIVAQGASDFLKIIQQRCDRVWTRLRFPTSDLIFLYQISCSATYITNLCYIYIYKKILLNRISKSDPYKM